MSIFVKKPGLSTTVQDLGRTGHLSSGFSPNGAMDRHAASVANIVNSLYSGVDSVLALSSMLTGEYGISDVCLSIPCLLGKNGIITTLTPKLAEDELAKLKLSAETLKGVIEKVQY